jgi:tetratricopeptide (TPR) repeat protein
LVDQALGLAPDQAAYLVLRGQLLLDLGHPLQAEQDLLAALALDPFQVQARWALIRLYRSYGLWREAQAECIRYLVLEPDAPDGWFTLGQIEENQNRKPEAIAAYSQTLALDPLHREGLSRRAVLWQELGELNAAWMDLTALLAVDPTAEGYRQRAELSLQLGSPMAAATDWADAIRLLPADVPSATLVMDMGQAYVDGGAAEEAVVAFRTAVSLTLNADSHLWLAESYLLIPDPNSALRVLSETVPTGPSELARLLTSRGRARLDLGDAQLAVEDFTLALLIESATQWERLLTWRSQAYQALEHWDRAIGDLTRAYQVSGNPLHLYRRALLYYQKQDYRAAAADLTGFLANAAPDLTPAALLTDAKQRLEALQAALP